ncbi:helix-turn-helix domain-containing protein [Muricauda sp. 2012CJ35-5]|uniref:Helix-turn-helix domain-containing protein n=1 Tax=Flagellimonas spongiicola TaxID=2942208 RepID=A0ABT0PVD9_9FLAO|nr:helix-turn-helix domain-containing protein [Allomuricauda spongiicola]MCL6275151.1 helix-turn-helix domain-containing protein [Allomuricauda spongiicola]
MQSNAIAYRAFFVVPPEVQLLDLAGPAHLLYEANLYGANIEAHYLSMNTSNAEVSCTGLSLGNLSPYNSFQLNANDLLFIPGLEGHLFAEVGYAAKNQDFLNWLKNQKENGARICAVCTGAYILGFAGLFDDKKCTTHWKYMDDFQNRFPKSKLLTDRLIVKDGTIYSSAGVSSGIDLALFVLEELYGPVFATKIAKAVVIYFRRTESDPQLSVFLQYRNHLDNRIHQVQDYLAHHLAKKVKMETLADLVHMSPRNLTRLFKKVTGLTVGAYLEKLRVERALQLLSDGSKVSAAANACGLKSSNQLRYLLRKHTDTLPSEL